ncbi:MOSC domain-containing protein [Sinimarinibacterium sp. CAU 1509]|uniref:MOSC domain-containing protein n=1 Tax=Sinimarinibacterium sp. CAU 1509 TaxID=2562283 RepID=UPI0010ACC056|nr:MOSC domain-containing protein [Sinimarinibacterium sp. CAU 1509]TJY65222.1 MOSC domain-containing protein [Sinimarinibacterium sp. CAU 1509]
MQSTCINSVYLGRVQPMPDDGRPTAIFKQPVTTVVDVGPEGLIGDTQADLRVHGGLEKAVHHFPARNLERLRAQFPDIAAQLVPGCMGENFSTDAWDEAEVCIGDIFRAGTVLLQLGQPRSPCWKIDARHGVDGMAQFIEREGIAGWYYRVIERGQVRAGDAITLVERNTDPVSLRAFWDLRALHRPSAAQMQRVIETPGLAPERRQRLQRRLEWLQQNA